MDVRIGNDIKINVDLSNVIDKNKCSIKYVQAYIVDTSNDKVFPPFYIPTEHTTNLCGKPVYNVLPVDPAMHMHCMGPHGNCHGRWHEVVNALKWG